MLNDTMGIEPAKFRLRKNWSVAAKWSVRTEGNFGGDGTVLDHDCSGG